MRRLASIALLGTLTLLASNAQSQVRGGGGMRSGGGGGIHVGGPSPRVSSGRSTPAGPVGFRPAPAARPSFARGPSFGTQAAPVGNLNAQRVNAQRFNSRNRVFFDGRSRRFHSGFFRHHNHIFFNNGFFGANCFGTFAFGNPFCNNFISSGFFFGDPFYSLGYGYGGYPYGYPSSPDYYPEQSSTSNDSNQIALTAEIQHLSDEIDDLRDEHSRDDRNGDQQSQDSARSQPSSGPTLSAVPPAAYTIFILRDGQRFTAQNYAISGQTLWILNERSARKTPLSDVDRAATEKANAANGVEVHLPEAVPPN